VTALPETEETSKPSLYYSSYEECLSSRHQGTCGGITYPSSTYVISDSQANKALNKVKVTNNKMCPFKDLWERVRNQCLKDCAVE
jgi:hypothetical protein